MILKILSGKDKGKLFPLLPFSLIGCGKECDIILNHSSIGDVHAQIEVQGKQYILKEKNKKNGIIHEGHYVNFIFLEKNMKLKLGEISVEILDRGDIEDFSQLVALEKQSSEKTQYIQKSCSEDSDFLKGFISEKSLIEDKVKALDFLEKPLLLDFERGTQKGTKWEVYYLPRTVGRQDADLPLLDPQAKSISFKLSLQKNDKSKKNEVIIKSKQSQLMLNYKSISEVVLKNKDLIVIGSAYIRVHL